MKKYFLFAATVLALAACNKDDENLTNGPVEARISAGVNTPETRAINDQWEQDAIGVMVTEAQTSNMEELYKNVKYTTTANTASAANFTAPEGQGIFFRMRVKRLHSPHTLLIRLRQPMHCPVRME